MPHMRIMTVLQGRTGVPEDQFVNTQYASCAGYTTAEMNGVMTCINEFWNNLTVASTRMASYLSAFIDTQATVRFYNMSDPLPRTPTIRDFTLAGSLGTQDLPEEVACCISWRGAPPVTPRRRGRNYIGPLSSNALRPDTDPSGFGPSRPSEAFMVTMKQAADRFMVNMAAAGTPLMIRSTRPSENYVAVAGGWVDDAWDTQRRRGVDPTSRMVFPDIA